jgi:hypothetical protein
LVVATFKNYDMVRTANGVEVFDPRWPDKPVYVAADTEQAKRWVSAFRDGATWAVMEAAR